MHVFFVALAVAVSANSFALSTSTVANKSPVVDFMDEERGVESSIKLFGKTISVPSEAVALLANQGNIRNHLADNVEKTKHHVLLRTPPGQTSSYLGKLQSTTTEAGFRGPTAREMGHSVRGEKRKMNSRDEPQRPQIQDAQRKVRTDRPFVRQKGKVVPLEDLIVNWRIDTTQLEIRKDEISKQLEQKKKEISKYTLPDKLELSDVQVKCMALGSIYFELMLNHLDTSARRNAKRLNDQLDKFDGSRLEQLGVDRAEVSKRAFDMFRNANWQPSNPEIVYMAIGMEFYRPPLPSGVSS